jgi:hypothetical protein
LAFFPLQGRLKSAFTMPAISNLSVNRTARKLRLRVPSALRAPAAGYLKRSALTHFTGN